MFRVLRSRNLVGAGWDPQNRSRNLGHEMDVILRYRPWGPLALEAGYGLFVPVTAAKRITGGDDPLHFVYARVGVTF